MKLLRHTLPIRIFHWTMFLTVSTLVLTGLYYENPIEAIHVPMRTVRMFHGAAGLILIANTLGQIAYYTINGKFREVLFSPKDITNLRSFLKYNLYITDREPNFGKYNPGQKALFTVWLTAIIVGSISGLVLLFINDTEWLQKIMPGLNTIQAIKYGVAILFAGTVPLHIYLGVTGDIAKLQAMITGYIQQEARRIMTGKEGP